MAPVTLGGYPAKRCARVTHNEFTPGISEPVPPRPDLEALRTAGIEFEEHVFVELRSRYEDSERLLLLDSDLSRTERQRRTVAAMTAGVEVIAGGCLPDVNGRRGLPDVLVRHRDGYLPVDIKNHRTVASAKRAEVEISTLSQPDRRLTQPGYSDHGASWRDDVMQLAHYTRMLQELGFHCGVNRGGIIGSSDLSALLGGDSLRITWYDPDAGDIPTYSASDPSHRRPRSALQRYDHEFAFRVDVARAAAAGQELVRPYRISECTTCAWFDHCATVSGDDDASFAIETGHLTIREWQYLYQHCGDGTALSVAQLAAVDVDTHIEAFRVQSVGTKMPQDRLANVVRRARMSCTGIDFEAHETEPPTVPAADIEVDFDIEWDDQGRIYQWGLRVRDGQDDTTARYQPVVSFDPLDQAAEAELAAEFASRMQQLRSHAARQGKSLQVFHWHHPEISSTRRFAEVARALDGLTYDLRKWFDATFFARTSSSIKQVAGFFGFRWEVDDPGGLASQGAIETARGNGAAADAARQWCLSYNECDVAAQAAIRDGVRLYRR